MPLTLLVTMLLAFAFSISIAVAIGGSAILGIALFDPERLILAPKEMFTAIDKFPLAAIPFFILAGNLMETGGISRRLVEFAKSIVGGVQGGLPMTCVLTCMIFAAVSGSSVATTFAIGTILIPALIKHGYPTTWAAALQATSAELGVIIPPSIPMILYALSSNASIAALFYAGILPGLLLCGGFMFACWWVGKRRNLPRETAPADRAKFRRDLFLSLPAIALPVLIVVFLRFGIATPTEVAVLAALFSGAVSALLYRDLSLKRLHHAILEAGLATGVVLLVTSPPASTGVSPPASTDVPASTPGPGGAGTVPSNSAGGSRSRVAASCSKRSTSAVADASMPIPT